MPRDTNLPAEPAGSTDPVDVELTVVGQVVVDDKGHLLHVDTTRPHVRGDQDTALPGSEISIAVKI